MKNNAKKSALIYELIFDFRFKFTLKLIGKGGIVLTEAIETRRSQN